jgi:sigma-B regulation protein RsbQ
MSVQQRNNVHANGEGSPTIIFAHGFGCDQTMWQYLRPEFDHRYRTVLFDLVGSGQSDLSAYDYGKYGSLHGYAADLLEIMDEFASGPVIYVGHSVSAMIGMIAAIEAPERFVANVMVGPSPSFINDGTYVGGFSRSDIDGLLETLESNYLGWSSTMAPAIMGSPDQPELGVELTNSFCRTDPEIAKHFARVTFLADHRADLAGVSTPTLILQSSDDLLAPLSVGEFMRAQIPGSTLSIVDNVGHCPHLSAPCASVDATKTFLRELGLSDHG